MQREILRINSPVPDPNTFDSIANLHNTGEKYCFGSNALGVFAIDGYQNNTRREFCFKIYSENMVVVVQYNILKIFTMHFSKINQTYFILYCSFINE